MLKPTDLPKGWSLGDSPIAQGRELDSILGMGDRPDSGGAVSWDEVLSPSGQRVLLRMAAPEVHDGRILNSGAKVTAVVVLPDPSGDRVTAAHMRFPLGAIEGAANLRSQDSAISINTALQSLEYVPPAPVGKPDGSDAFYARVALLWRYFQNDPNPTERVREVCQTSLSTAQRWVTEARRRKFLPPGRRGRAK